MVLVHGLLVIPDSWRFLSVEVTRWIGRCAIGELEIIGWIEISCQVVRRQLSLQLSRAAARGTPANKEIIICADLVTDVFTINCGSMHSDG